MQEYLRRTWVEVDLDAIRQNYENISALVTPGSRLIAVVKADAYGHGVENVVKELTQAGCNDFAVSNLEEAMQVRFANDDCSILILGYTPPEYARVLAVNDITQTILNLDYAKELSQNAVKADVTVDCHIKVDTGMGRLGFVFHDSQRDIETVSLIKQAATLPGINAEGIFTHFSSADEFGEGENYTAAQYDLFVTLIDCLRFEGVEFKVRHCCNSAATVLHPEMHLDGVRPGIILYGLKPSDCIEGKVELRPALKLKTVVSMVKAVDEGTSISYGRHFTADKKMKIATIPIGYADGFPRILSGNTFVGIHGQYAPVLGNICMDQCMIDVTEIPDVKEGDSVTVFDTDLNSPLSVDRLAEKCNTINYELICGLNRRVPRVYIKGGETTAIADYMK